MQDVEIDSLLSESGYQFDPASGRYQASDAEDGDLDFPTEEVADQLEIPIEDLIRWEEQSGGEAG